MLSNLVCWQGMCASRIQGGYEHGPMWLLSSCMFCQWCMMPEYFVKIVLFSIFLNVSSPCLTMLLCYLNKYLNRINLERFCCMVTACIALMNFKAVGVDYQQHLWREAIECFVSFYSKRQLCKRALHNRSMESRIERRKFCLP
jgi:hypothetical protein